MANNRSHTESPSQLQKVVDVQRHINDKLRKEVEGYKHDIERLKQLDKHNQRLLIQLMGAQEREKKHVSTMLHSNVSQYLTLILLHSQRHYSALEQGPSNETPRVLNDLVIKTQEALDELRRISMQLRPSTLDDIGLLATLTWFIREFQSTYPQILIDDQINVDEQVLYPRLKTILFRVVEEAFNNVAEHAQATSISFTLNITGFSIDLVIADNGKGFHYCPNEPQTKGNGLGVQIMRSRVEHACGDFSINSSLARGTVIKACWASMADVQ